MQVKDSVDDLSKRVRGLEQMEKRITQLQVGCPVPLHSMYTAELPSRADAFAAEYRVHRAMSRRRSSGEWFRFDRGDGLEQLFTSVDQAVDAEHGMPLVQVNKIRFAEFKF